MQDYVTHNIVVTCYLEDDVYTLYVKRMNYSESQKYRYRGFIFRFDQ
jgi:hypothetical protein